MSELSSEEIKVACALACRNNLLSESDKAEVLIGGYCGKLTIFGHYCFICGGTFRSNWTSHIREHLKEYQAFI